MRKIFTTALAIVALLAFARAAAATHISGHWAEVGDAGDLLGTAQTALGFGSLTQITGTIGSPTDVDLYQFFIDGGGTFSATTVGQPGTLVDTQLFLFDEAGRGVYGNDDVVGGVTLRSTLPAFHPLTPLVPGIYFLAVTPFNRDPVSSLGLIFPDFVFRAVLGPTGSGGASPLSGYIGTGVFQGFPATYTVALTGAQLIPEPSSLALLSMGGLALLGYCRRRGTRSRPRDRRG